MASVLSLVAAAALAFGYVGHLGVVYVRNDLPGPPTVCDTVRCEVWSGRVICLIQHRSVDYPRTMSLMVPSFRPGLRGEAGLTGTRDLVWRQAAYGFNARWLSVPAPDSTYLLSVPVWVPGFACAFAPLLWWRARRRRANAVQAGFAVLPARHANWQ